MKIKFWRPIVILTSIITLMTLLINQSFAVQTTEFNITKKTIAIGETCFLKLNGITDNIRWYSSEKKIVYVNSNGMIIGKSKGFATVYAKVKNKTYEFEITVKKHRIVALTKEFETTQLYVEGEKHNKKATWSSSNPNIATVDNNGLVTAKSSGDVKIMCKIGNSTISTNLIIKSKLLDIEGNIISELDKYNFVKDVVVNKQTAIKIGTALLEAYYSDGSITGKPMDAVEKNGVWRVYNVVNPIIETEDGQIRLISGGVLYVEFLKSTGEVIKFGVED